MPKIEYNALINEKKNMMMINDDIDTTSTTITNTSNDTSSTITTIPTANKIV